MPAATTATLYVEKRYGTWANKMRNRREIRRTHFPMMQDFIQHQVRSPKIGATQTCQFEELAEGGWWLEQVGRRRFHLKCDPVALRQYCYKLLSSRTTYHVWLQPGTTTIIIDV